MMEEKSSNTLKECLKECRRKRREHASHNHVLQIDTNMTRITRDKGVAILLKDFMLNQLVSPF
jgi:hypothetical protein